MSTEVVKVGNSVIQVTDKRSGSRQHIEGVKYSIILDETRQLLADDLKQLIDSVFSLYGDDRVRITQHLATLKEVVGLFAIVKERNLHARLDDIQHRLDQLLDLLLKLDAYSSDRKSLFYDWALDQDLKSITKKLLNVLSLRLSPREETSLEYVDFQTHRYLTVDCSNFSPSINESFAYREVETEKKPVYDDKKQREWLASLSPDLLSAYTETEDFIREVTPIAVDAEDQYFIEQIYDDYYLHIFESLKSLSDSKTEFAHKETVVVECIKQFRIIQLGLQKIIDRAVEQRLSKIKSQTDFLRNKVMGSNAFSLNPEELESAVDSSLEESQRVREELYKLHVAPILEQNKKEYEEALERQKTTYDESLKRQEAAHKATEKALHSSLSNLYKERLASKDAHHEVTIKAVKMEHYRYVSQLQVNHANTLENLKAQYRHDLQQLTTSADELRYSNNQQEAYIATLETEKESLITKLQAVQAQIYRAQGRSGELERSGEENYEQMHQELREAQTMISSLAHEIARFNKDENAAKKQLEEQRNYLASIGKVNAASLEAATLNAGNYYGQGKWRAPAEETPEVEEEEADHFGYADFVDDEDEYIDWIEQKDWS